MNLLTYINDIQNWFTTSERAYPVYVCRPSIGYKVSNKINGETYYTSKQRQFVISRCSGEKWIVSGKELADGFTLKDSAEVQETVLKSLLRADGTFDWQKMLQKKKNEHLWAIQIPLEIQNAQFIQQDQNSLGHINKKGITHGQGDFLIADDKLGCPDLLQLRLVNGEVFNIMYDIQKFRGVLVKPKRISKPTSIGEVKESTDDTIKMEIVKVELCDNPEQRNVAVIRPYEIHIQNSRDTDIRSKINDLADWFESQDCSIDTYDNYTSIILSNTETLGVFGTKLKAKNRCKFIVQDDLQISNKDLQKLGSQQAKVIEWIHRTYKIQIDGKEQQLNQLLNSMYELRIPAIVVLGKEQQDSDGENKDNIQISNILNGFCRYITKQELDEICKQGLVINI